MSTVAISALRIFISLAFILLLICVSNNNLYTVHICLKKLSAILLAHLLCLLTICSFDIKNFRFHIFYPPNMSIIVSSFDHLLLVFLNMATLLSYPVPLTCTPVLYLLDIFVCEPLSSPFRQILLFERVIWFSILLNDKVWKARIAQPHSIHNFLYFPLLRIKRTFHTIAQLPTAHPNTQAGLCKSENSFECF